MKFPRVRSTVRRMMVAVAFVGLAFGAYLACRVRAERFQDSARWHRVRHVALVIGGGDESPSLARLEWHKAMAEKYDRAARYPWFPVAPDPPEPR